MSKPAAKSEPLPDDPQQLKALVQDLRGQLAWYQEQHQLTQAKRFAHTQDVPPEQTDLGLFNEAEQECHREETSPVRAHKRKRRQRGGGREELPPHLPREEVVHEGEAHERLCECGGERHVIGEEVSEQLEHIPGQLKVLVHRRKRYGCRSCEQGVVEAPRPAEPIPGSRAAPGLLATILVAKYLDAMPLYRQERYYARQGVPMLDRSVLSHWTVRAGELLEPLVDRLHACLLGAGVLHADETPLQVLKEPGRKARQKSTMWVYGTGGREPPILIYCYQPTRGSEHPIEFLDGYAGYLQRDGFSGYRRLERLRPQIQGVGCMAHVRRKFVDVLKGQPTGGGDSFAEEVVERIGALYGIEREIAELDDTERYRQRQERAVPRLEALRKRLDEKVSQVPPKSLLGKAIGYARNEWPYLVRYVEDGRLKIDNSYIERAIKPFVIGRKNFLFSNTPRGARASANHYTVIETARANGLDPHAYLQHLFRHLPGIDPDHPVGLDALLPWNVNLEG